MSFHTLYKYCYEGIPDEFNDQSGETAVSRAPTLIIVYNTNLSLEAFSKPSVVKTQYLSYKCLNLIITYYSKMCIYPPDAQPTIQISTAEVRDKEKLAFLSSTASFSPASPHVLSIAIS